MIPQPPTTMSVAKPDTSRQSEGFTEVSPLGKSLFRAPGSGHVAGAIGSQKSKGAIVIRSSTICLCKMPTGT